MKERDLNNLVVAAEAMLVAHSLACWFPRCIDGRQGGFHQDFGNDWSPGPVGQKSLVFQSRMTWVAATMARRRPNLVVPCPAADFAAWADDGIAYIGDTFWDPIAGGLRFRQDQDQETHSYAIAFALFAAAACDRLAPNATARAFADNVFEWWDACAHDYRFGGYCDALTSTGRPILSGRNRARDLIGVPYGYRSANTLLHVLEALAELFRARQSQSVRVRLEEIVTLLEKLLRRDGYRLFAVYDREWRPVDRTVSFGHDLEAAYLDARARRCLGWPLSPGSRALADRALRLGTDNRFGGLFFEQHRWRIRPVDQKVWWVQAEAVNALIDLLETHSQGTGRYLGLLYKHWDFLNKHQLDHRLGGWLDTVSRNGLQVIKGRKGHEWKACYHEVRALLNVADGARRIAKREEAIADSDFPNRATSILRPD
jgi:mannobiose 2-epimerase